MAYKFEVKKVLKVYTTMFEDMKIGDVAVIVDQAHGQYGHHILRTWESFVSLTDPHKTWIGKTFIQVHILPNPVLTLTHD